MFDDKRSKKAVFVAHCILNQNAKLDKCAHYPGPIRETAQLLLDSGVGVIQLPCPELMYLGLDRETEETAHPTVMEEDTRIARRMRTEKSQAVCQRIVDDILYQIEEYQKHGFEIIGFVGINGSPTCGVNTTWMENKEVEGYGVLVSLLFDALSQKGIAMDMTGIKACDPVSAQQAVKSLLDD